MTLSEAPTDWSTLNASSLAFGAIPVLGGADPMGASITLQTDLDVNVGDPWSFTPPSGLTFPSGGNLSASSGLVT